ncbi:hypothetical protein GCM10023082_00240 [Streptomyces tremellae]|uniref:Uncharacterized protein n=1 Tax=Streptomyces tremellae TaxID=1124239 RepID=A0ABP7DIH0_9ACTN
MLRASLPGFGPTPARTVCRTPEKRAGHIRRRQSAAQAFGGREKGGKAGKGEKGASWQRIPLPAYPRHRCSRIRFSFYGSWKRAGAHGGRGPGAPAACRTGGAAGLAGRGAAAGAKAAGAPEAADRKVRFAERTVNG